MKDLLKELKKYKTWTPPGHFYSPIPDVEAIIKRRDKIFNTRDRCEGIDMNIDGQLDFLKSCKDYYDDIPFPEQKQSDSRFYLENNMFGYADSISLYLMIRSYKPSRIVEVGSGYSSAVMLDTCEYVAELNNTKLTFIEPYPERLNSLISDKDIVNLHECMVQDTPREIFTDLEANDVLFIDSSHVSKAGSDVNYLFFEILPILKPGVIIHIHDIGINFQYPFKWIEEGRAWNESYLLRAFLMNNKSYEIVLFNAQLYNRKLSYFQNYMPLYTKGPGGSFWMRKISR